MKIWNFGLMFAELHDLMFAPKSTRKWKRYLPFVADLSPEYADGNVGKCRWKPQRNPNDLCQMNHKTLKSQVKGVANL